jgi:hypothetical protein
MSSTTTSHSRRHRPSKPRDLRVGWANVGKSQPCHITILHLGHTEKLDILCIQEPWTSTGTRTQNHPGYDCYAPVDTWETDDIVAWEARRPRVMTYIRKGAGIRTQQRRSVQSRDLLWVEANGFSILNVYRCLHTVEALDYTTHLAVEAETLVGGDFNVRHEMFEPGSRSLYGGDTLAQWSAISRMDYIGAPGAATHNAEHVLDFTFSNVPFATIQIREDLHSGSDYETQVTTLLGRGRVPLDQFHYRVPEEELSKLAGIVKSGVAILPDPATLGT